DLEASQHLLLACAGDNLQRRAPPARSTDRSRAHCIGATAMTLPDLIARLEKATGPDRELDGRIWCAINGYEFVQWDGAGCVYRAKSIGHIDARHVKDWTG